MLLVMVQTQQTRGNGVRAGTARVGTRAAVWLALAALCPSGLSAESKAGAHFRKEVQPILAEYCYDCHGDGMNKGQGGVRRIQVGRGAAGQARSVVDAS